MNGHDNDLLFTVQTPLGFSVRCHHTYWVRKIVAQHLVMVDRVEQVKQALRTPDEVRVSRIDENVYIFYIQAEKRLVCAVARTSTDQGFLITAYPADKMKEGRTVWKK